MNNICQEVRGFLESLRRDLPGIFSGGRSEPVHQAPPFIPVPAPLPSFIGQIGRAQAGVIIRDRVRQLGSALGLGYGRVFIKDQKTVWASCSGKKNLNFNWRLAAAPPEILDYVVIHELCHLREMNHSRRFWDLVGGHCPDYKSRKKWLKDD